MAEEGRRGVIEGGEEGEGEGRGRGGGSEDVVWCYWRGGNMKRGQRAAGRRRRFVLKFWAFSLLCLLIPPCKDQRREYSR